MVHHRNREAAYAEGASTENSGSFIFNWLPGMTIPAGSQLPNGDLVPEGAEPKPDGTVLLPGGITVKWHEITLPNGFLLTSILRPGKSEAAAKPAGKMPDGSKINFKWNITWPKLSISSSTFRWGAGMTIPAGSQLPDGKQVPEGAEPRPDGTVLLPGGITVKWDEITLPDGCLLTYLLRPGKKAPKPAAKMPDGSKPSVAFGSGWWFSMMSSSSSAVSTGVC